MLTDIAKLSHLIARMHQCSSLNAKVAWLAALPDVAAFLQSHPWLVQALQKASDEERSVAYQLIAIGQGPTLLRPLQDKHQTAVALDLMLKRLVPVDHFYATMGGLLGYQATIARLMAGEDLGPYARCANLRYSVPKGVDLREDSALVREAIIAGIRHVPETALFFAVGGAGDRLRLFDSASGEPLPAACLPFAGAGSLIDLLVRDVQALEFLHYKLFGKRVVMPIAMMTSEEKNNHAQLLELCESRQWFGRPKESFFLFMQPRVPVVSQSGVWAETAPFSPVFKPGGHGVIWKLAVDNGVFDWLDGFGSRKALVRQINNPVASTDAGLLAFAGIGWQYDKLFGFASCDRRLNAPEGMNVLVECQEEGRYDYRLTNVEYTDFAKHGLHDQPAEPGSPYSGFPCNTNILFLDLQAVRDVVPEHPLPGMLVNCKSRFPVTNANGESEDVPGGRLEGTMQNVADYLVDTKTVPWDGVDPLAFHSYLTFNARNKTVAVVKNASPSDAIKDDTAESCYYVVLENYRDLLVNHCAFQMPDLAPLACFLDDPLPFVIQLHPALGPLYNVIAQKLRAGHLAHGSHLLLEIAELSVANLHLDGSLQVRCTQPLGAGTCILNNVNVRNRGIDREKTQVPWRDPPVLTESLEIVIEGHGAFIAENVTIDGPLRVVVGPAERVTLSQDVAGKLALVREPLLKPSWHWEYTNDVNANIVLGKKIK